MDNSALYTSSISSIINGLSDHDIQILTIESVYSTIINDMAKTFVCMNHEILLAKLHFNGIGRVGLPEEWFYLSNRRQNVEVKSPNTTINVSSVWGTLKHGANKVHFCMHQDFKHFTTFTDNP